MVFEIKDKVALVTGGASGIGYLFVLKLLEKGARGVTLADIDEKVGINALQEIETKFGKNKAIFVKTDVSNYEQFEDAFKKTIEEFKNIDILINNAGLLNDSIWEKEISVNVNGTLHGILLGLDNYLPKFKSGAEAVIVNLSSLAGILPMVSCPVYTLTKFAIHGMTLAFGHSDHYQRSNVRVVSVHPGATGTSMLTEMTNRNLGPAYEKIRQKELENVVPQTQEQIAPGLIAVIEKAPIGTAWIIEGGQPPYQYKVADPFKSPKQYLP